MNNNMQAMLKSMDKEWGKVKDEEIESIKEEKEDVENEMEEVAEEEEKEEKEIEEEMEENGVDIFQIGTSQNMKGEENLVDSVPKAKAGLDNIVLTTYTVKKSSSRSEALMAFHERKRLENLKLKQLKSSSVIPKMLPALTPVPPPPAPSDLHPQSTTSPSPTSVDLHPSNLGPSPTSESDVEEEVMMEVSLSPPPWLNSPLPDNDQDEEMEDKDEEVEAIMMKKYAAEGFLHSDSNDNIVSESGGEGEREPTAGATENVGLKRKREEEKVKEEDKINDETEKELIVAPTIATSWRQAIGSNKWVEVGFKSDLTGYKLKRLGGYVKIKEEHHFINNLTKTDEVKVEMRNVRRQLGIQNWDLDVPMVVENRTKESHPLQCSHTCPWSGNRCQAAFREREEKLYQYHTRYTCPYRGRSDDKLNPGNRLQQRWDPELECSRCRVRMLSSLLESHWDSTHRLVPCQACKQLFQTEDDIADHLQFEHGTHFIAAPTFPAPTWKSHYMAAERRPPTPKAPSRPPSPDSSPCPSPVHDSDEEEQSFAPIERASDHNYTSGFIAAPRPVRPLAPKSYLKGPNATPGRPSGPRSYPRAPQPRPNFRPPNLANYVAPRVDAVPRVGQQLSPGATLAAVGPQVVTVKGQDGKVVQKIALKAGQGVVQMTIEGRTVLKVVEVPNHQMASPSPHGLSKTAGLPPHRLTKGFDKASPATAPQSYAPRSNHPLGKFHANAKGYNKPSSTPSGIFQSNAKGYAAATTPSISSHLQQVVTPVQVKNFTPPTMQQQARLPVKMPQKTVGLPTIHWTPQQLADLQASFPAHMLPKKSAPQGKPPPLSSVRTPVIINSNGLPRLGNPGSTNVPKIQPNQQLKPVTIQKPVSIPSSAPSSSNSSIPSWAPGGSKPLIKQVKTSTGQLVWAQAVSSEQIPGSDKAVFKFKALGPVDPNNPNTPPPALKPDATQPTKKTNLNLACPFANCSETFSTLDEMNIHGGLHGFNGEKGSCPHCKIGYNRWGNLFNHVFKAGCTQQGLAAPPGPFLCPTCAEEAISASALRLHCETKHSSAMPTCPGCGITYNRWGNLLNHIFGPAACPLATPRPPTKCTACDEELGTLHNLHQHLLNQRCLSFRFQCHFPSQPVCGKHFSTGPSLSNHISTVHESRSGVARRNQVASAYASGDVDANTRTTLLRQITSSIPTSSLEALPTPTSGPRPLATYPGFRGKRVLPKPALVKISSSQDLGVDPLEEIDPYPGEDEVKEVEVDPLADPLGGVSPPRDLGGVSPPRNEEGPTSDLGAVILG